MPEQPTRPDAGGGRRRVLVVGINYSPEHTGIAPYTTQFCEHLAAQGYAVTVLAGVPHYPQWSVERRYRRRLRTKEERGGLLVERLRHYVPRRQSALRRGLYELTFAMNVALRRPTGRPDLVVAVVPALLGVGPASMLARRAGAPLMVWVQDLMGQASVQSGIVGGRSVGGLVTSIEAAMLKRADRVLVLNEHFARHLRGSGIAAERILVQPNWTHVPPASGERRAEIRARYGWRESETVVLHSGNMGLKQALENVVGAGRAAVERGRSDIRFVLMGDGSQREVLEAAAAGVRGVDIVAPAASEDYSDVLAAADVLLVNERATSLDMSLPSKLTSYFGAGRPVLAASPAGGGTAAEVGRSGGGLVVEPESPARLLDAVCELAADPGRAAELARAGREYALTRLTAPEALARIETVVAELCGARGPRHGSRASRAGRARTSPSSR